MCSFIIQISCSFSSQCIRTSIWLCKCKAGNLLSFGHPRQIMVFLFIRSIMKKQLTRTQRIGHRNHRRNGGRHTGDFGQNSGLSSSRKSQSTIFVSILPSLVEQIGLRFSSKSRKNLRLWIMLSCSS